MPQFALAQPLGESLFGDMEKEFEDVLDAANNMLKMWMKETLDSFDIMEEDNFQELIDIAERFGKKADKECEAGNPQNIPYLYIYNYLKKSGRYDNLQYNRMQDYDLY